MEIGRIIANDRKLDYKIKVATHMGKRHVDQIINIGSNVPLGNDRDLKKESYRELKK